MRAVIGKRRTFKAPGCGGAFFSDKQFQAMAKHQVQLPTPITGTRERAWWWFENRIYCADQAYRPEDVLALVRVEQRSQRRQLERAHDALRLEQQPRPIRQPIPQDVRRAVFTRDGGRCVECGSTFDLQYDHIIPVARGGATTAENLQVLCANCNREKSDQI